MDTEFTLEAIRNARDAEARALVRARAARNDVTIGAPPTRRWLDVWRRTRRSQHPTDFITSRPDPAP